MREKLKITEGIFPMPVLMIATYNEDGSVNVMNAAWGTMQERDTVVLNLTESHKTVKNIKARGAFTVSIADAAHVTEADYFGVESGNKVSDKFARSGLTSSRAETVVFPLPPFPMIVIALPKTASPLSVIRNIAAVFNCNFLAVTGFHANQSTGIITVFAVFD